MKALARTLVLFLALTVVALPWPVVAQTDQEILRELRELKEELRWQRFEEETDAELREQRRDDARLRERQEREFREFQRHLRRGLGPLPCCDH